MEFENRDFIQLVKRTREKFSVSLSEAHDMIFANEELRRLVAWRINHDRECRDQALETFGIMAKNLDLSVRAKVSGSERSNGKR